MRPVYALTSCFMQVVWNSAVVEAYGNEKGRLGGVKVENVKTKEVRDIQVSFKGHDWGFLHLMCTKKLMKNGNDGHNSDDLQTANDT